jgi:hypothetical protein
MVELVVGGGGGGLVLVAGGMIGLVLVEEGGREIAPLAPGGEIELDNVVLELDPTGGWPPCNARVQVLTSRIASRPSASFTGVKTRTQLTITVPIADSAVRTEVSVRGSA